MYARMRVCETARPRANRTVTAERVSRPPERFQTLYVGCCIIHEKVSSLYPLHTTVPSPFFRGAVL